MIWFEIPGAPEGKARPRVLRCGRAYTPQRTRVYEDLVRSCYESAIMGVKQGKDGGGDAFRVEIYAYYPIPQSASKRKKTAMEAGELLPTKKPDWDNVGKIVCDALNGCAWKDDSQIVDAVVHKRYAAVPRVVVEIERI